MSCIQRNRTEVIYCPDLCSDFQDVHIRDLSVAVPRRRPNPLAFLQCKRGSSSNNDTESGTQAQGDDYDNHDDLIIRNITATVRRGEILAVIGGSGSGKTTLLHAVAGQLASGVRLMRGGVRVVPASDKDVLDTSATADGDGPWTAGEKTQDVIGFVRQNDYLLPHLTGTFLIFIFF
jgi:ABC-type multidrug transport system ATPase subunit